MRFSQGNIYAEIILDSINRMGNRLTTFRVRFPKFVLAEFNTHRKLSRNASSSRAVPSWKMRKEAWNPDTRVTPVHWGANQSGMQARIELAGWKRWIARKIWGFAARTACVFSYLFEKIGLHKQLANRILEPFIHVTVVVTSTEFMNFFGLRLHEDAQPEIRVLAERMWFAYNNSEPTLLQEDQWHLPFLTDNELLNLPLELKKKISVARCARTSYVSFESGKKSTPEEDEALYYKLVGAQPIHPSPAEHQANPDVFDDKYNCWKNPQNHGNFEGWNQLRKFLPGEAIAPIPIVWIVKDEENAANILP